MHARLFFCSKNSIKFNVHNRFFSTKSIKLPDGFTSLETYSDCSKIEKLAQLRAEKMWEMKQAYPQILSYDFHGNIGYTLRKESPQEMVKQGGLIAHEDLWFSNTGSGHNRGSICLSLLPEVPCVFYNHRSAVKDKHPKIYLYAFPLKGRFFLPGSMWREIISPGALPITYWWFCRKVDGITKNNQIVLGELVGHAEDMVYPQGERFQAYLENKLIKPKEYHAGEDYPSEFDIIDTPASRQMQQEIDNHYKKTGFIRRYF